MWVEYYPVGVCSRRMLIQLEDGVVTDLRVEGGCSGNLQGLSQLVKGLPAEEVIARLEGIRCGQKPTSCPDQLACALRLALDAEANQENADPQA